MTSIQAILEDEDKCNAVVKAVFEQFDKNGDGSISREELTAAMEEFAKQSDCADMEELTPEKMEEAYNELDKNKDGKLSEDEFKVLIVEVLKTLA